MPPKFDASVCSDVLDDRPLREVTYVTVRLVVSEDTQTAISAAHNVNWSVAFPLSASSVGQIELLAVRYVAHHVANATQRKCKERFVFVRTVFRVPAAVLALDPDHPAELTITDGPSFQAAVLFVAEYAPM